MKDIRNIIKEAYTAPEPVRKDDFLRMHRAHLAPPRMSAFTLTLQQAGYIRKAIWPISLGILLLGIRSLWLSAPYALMLASALMPFAAGLAVLESFRSEHRGMAELERATLISSRGIWFARMAALGIVHLGMILVLSVALSRNEGIRFWITGAVLTAPYLLCSLICLAMERTAFGRENPFVYLIIAGALALAMAALLTRREWFTGTTQALWCVAAVVLLAANVWEIRRRYVQEAPA